MVNIQSVRCPAVKLQMQSGLVVEPQIALQTVMRRADGVMCVHIPLIIICNALSETFDDQDIPPAVFTVSADLNPLVFHAPRELMAGELNPLIGVDDLVAAIHRIASLTELKQKSWVIVLESRQAVLGDSPSQARRRETQIQDASR
jgi:hypothetical protein